MIVGQNSDEYWMNEALKEAKMALAEGEVPVGAVVVHDNTIIGRGHNRTETLRDPTAHAEIVALSAAAASLNNWRLNQVTVYVTVEPCVMCTGALVLARIKKLVFGVHDGKFGACGSVYDIPRDGSLNHKFEVSAGVSMNETKKLLQEFFRVKRLQAKSNGEKGLCID
jgi:tRNA(adenine34) deaminase